MLNSHNESHCQSQTLTQSYASLNQFFFSFFFFLFFYLFLALPFCFLLFVFCCCFVFVLVVVVGITVVALLFLSFIRAAFSPFVLLCPIAFLFNLICDGKIISC